MVREIVRTCAAECLRDPRIAGAAGNGDPNIAHLRFGRSCLHGLIQVPFEPSCPATALLPCRTLLPAPAFGEHHPWLLTAPPSHLLFGSVQSVGNALFFLRRVGSNVLAKTPKVTGRQ